MHYDVDIVVIGAGPAGIASAIRARWVKTARAVPASVLLVDPAGLGGIAVMGTVNLTGPAFGFRGKDLVEQVLGDVRALEIPLLQEAATGIRRAADGCWEVQTSSRTLRSLAVVLATGLRQLSNEPEIRPTEYLAILSGGYARAALTFTKWSDYHQGKHLVVIGGTPLAADRAVFEAYDQGRNHIELICEPRQRAAGFRLQEDGVEVAVREGGAERTIVCDKVMIDYHSLQLAPSGLAFLPPSLRDPHGYATLGPDGTPAYPGLYAAGDCHRPPSACLKALSEGSEAGFNAYRYVYERKFGAAPHLFAFYVSDARPPLDEPELPSVDPAIHTPVGLTAKSAFPGVLAGGEGGLTAQSQDALQREMGAKVATVHGIASLRDVARGEDDRLVGIQGGGESAP